MSRKRFDGKRYCEYMHSLFSFLTIAFSMFARPSIKMSRMYTNVSSDLPLKNKTLPRNFCSSSRIEATGLPPMLKGTTAGLPLERENYLHFEGFIFMPMDETKRIRMDGLNLYCSLCTHAIFFTPTISYILRNYLLCCMFKYSSIWKKKKIMVVWHLGILSSWHLGILASWHLGIH